MATPEISVIVPVYRVEPYIRQCLESIAAQTFESLEVICVDDCGGDRSINIAEEFAARDKRFTIIRHEKNLGLGGARNTGMSAARGKYIAFVDSDDWILPEKYEKEYRKIEKTGLPSIWSKFYLCYDSGDSEKKARFSRVKEGEIDLSTDWITNHYPAAWNKLYRAECLRKSSMKFLEHVNYEDADFNFRFYCLYHRTNLLDEYLYMYRQRGDSITGITMSGGANCPDWLVIYENCHDFLKAAGLWEGKSRQFIKFMSDTSDMFLDSRKYREDVISILQHMLEKINYPEKFARDRIPTLDAAFNWRKNKIPPKIAGLLLLFNRITPFSDLRRRWRKALCLYR